MIEHRLLSPKRSRAFLSPFHRIGRPSPYCRHISYVLEGDPLNADYEILTYLPGWEQQKWSYLSIAFITRPKSRKGAITSKKTHENGNSAELEVKAEAAAKELLKGVPHGQGSVDKSNAPTPASISDSLVIVPLVTSLGPSVDSSALTSGIASPIPAPFVATNGSPSSAEDNSGAPSPEMQEALDAIRLRIPEGATLHAVAVSQYCYKLGRVTIPPRVALIACGFGGPISKALGTPSADSGCA